MMDAVAPSRRITWLQLSDFHFRADKSWERDVVLDSLCRDVLQRLHDEDLAPDAIFVAGDIANSGQHAEYLSAQRFFSRVAEMLSVNPATSWFVTPGNHDVDRAQISAAAKQLRGTLRDSSQVNAILEDRHSVKLFTRRQQAFFEFTHDFLGPSRAWRPEEPWRVETLRVRDALLVVLGLNSSWSAGSEDDDAHIFLGEFQLRQALKCADQHPEGIRIALLHHPIENMRDFDRGKSEALLTGAGGVHFVLRGHLHQTRMKLRREPDASTLELASGACWEGARHPHGIVLAQLDLDSGRGEIHFWRFDGTGRGVWKRDNFAYEKVDGGRWAFDIPSDWGVRRVRRITEPSIQTRPAQIGVRWDHGSYRVGSDRCRALVHLHFDPSNLATEQSKDSEPPRARVHHVLLLDLSASMRRPDKYPLLKEAVTTYLDAIAEEDLISLIGFSSDHTIFAGAESVASLRRRVPDAGMLLDGWPQKFRSTQMTQALRSAHGLILRARENEFTGVERVACLTDGALDDFVDCTFALAEIPPVELSVLGFGSDFEVDRAKTLVEPRPGATVRYVRAGHGDLGEYFGHMARTSQRIVMTDAVLSIKVADNVTCGNVFWCRPREGHIGTFEQIAQPLIQCQIGSVELHKTYLLLIELRPWSNSGPIAEICFSARMIAGEVFELHAQLQPPYGTQLGSADHFVFDMANSVASLIDSSPDTEISALEAKIKLCEIENHPRPYIDALRRKLTALKSGAHELVLSEDDLNYIDACVQTATHAGMDIVSPTEDVEP
jgi:hypothetical protein